MGNIFSDPSTEAKLRANPKTREYMKDPTFMSSLRNLQQNPETIGQHLKDPRIMEAMGVMMGLDIAKMGGKQE